MTRDDIVEAGAKAMYERSPEPGVTWERLDRGVKVEYRRDFEAGLDATLKPILAGVEYVVFSDPVLGRHVPGGVRELIEEWTP